jgi:hypothetical protein
MNLLTAIAVYATLCKHKNIPLRFPGPERAADVLYQGTDARLVARATAWAGLAESARNQDCTSPITCRARRGTGMRSFRCTASKLFPFVNLRPGDLRTSSSTAPGTTFRQRSKSGRLASQSASTASKCSSNSSTPWLFVISFRGARCTPHAGWPISAKAGPESPTGRTSSVRRHFGASF